MLWSDCHLMYTDPYDEAPYEHLLALELFPHAKCSHGRRSLQPEQVTRLGIAVAAVWHITDHYGQLVVYLRLNGIVPPITQQYPLTVR